MKIRFVSDNIYPVYLAQILIDYKTKYAYEDQFFYTGRCKQDVWFTEIQWFWVIHKTFFLRWKYKNVMYTLFMMFHRINASVCSTTSLQLVMHFQIAFCKYVARKKNFSHCQFLQIGESTTSYNKSWKKNMISFERLTFKSLLTANFFRILADGCKTNFMSLTNIAM